MRKLPSWGVVAFAFAIGAVSATAASPKVSLIEVSREGEPLRSSSIPELSLEQDRAGRLIAFVFGEQWPGPCSPTYCSSSYAATYFRITKWQRNECGAITYV